ncbi:MAG TPA: alpha-glucan family phosphorylase, partial [Thermomicrobiales bacterium]|nr:alpha-glucan family phosphorylase [Thermomicrobiales bacterium]
MWHDLFPDVRPADAPITSITNGVHLPTWIAAREQALLDRWLAPDWRARQQEQSVWNPVVDIPDEALWAVHIDGKRDLRRYLREYIRRRWTSGELDPAQVIVGGAFFDPSCLTIGFARRFATYKRATLIFHDIDRLSRILTDPDRPAQLIFAGKAHPADEGGKRLIQEIYWRARDPRLRGRVIFAEDYDMALAARLVAGVDVWLNNPRAPLEASGTSGMKAGVNGVLNLSILDGWWIEGWEPGNEDGWGIEPSPLDEAAQNAEEANAIYDLLERQVVPRYYDQRDERDVPTAWIRMAKESIRVIAPRFSAQRMVIEYIERLYLPAAAGRFAAVG